jgi:hypothetical protein
VCGEAAPLAGDGVDEEHSMMWRGVCVSAALAAGAAQGATKTFTFAEVGTTYTGFFFPDDPFNGQHVVMTRVYLTLIVPDGSDAGFFNTDISFPLIPDEGAINVLALSGEGLGWSGAGKFTTYIETTDFNGTFYSTLFGAATSPLEGAVISEDSRIEMDAVPGPGTASLIGLALATASRRRR